MSPKIWSISYWLFYSCSKRRNLITVVKMFSIRRSHFWRLNFSVPFNIPPISFNLYALNEFFVNMDYAKLSLSHMYASMRTDVEQWWPIDNCFYELWALSSGFFYWEFYAHKLLHCRLYLTFRRWFILYWLSPLIFLLISSLASFLRLVHLSNACSSLWILLNARLSTASFPTYFGKLARKLWSILQHRYTFTV